MITMKIIGVPEVVAMLKHIPPKVHAKLEGSMGRALLKLLVRVKQDKLTGQVLHVQTGRLRRSIHQEMQWEAPNKLVGIVGTNVKYAAVHEYGFTGVESVRGHLRRIAKSGRSFPVRPFTRHVNITERSFLRSTLREMQEELRNELLGGIDDALR